jgi:hypothetical protein
VTRILLAIISFAMLISDKPATQPVSVFREVATATLTTERPFRKDVELTRQSLTADQQERLGSFFTDDRVGGRGGWTCAVRFELTYENGKTASVAVDPDFSHWATPDGLGDRFMKPGLREEIIRLFGKPAEKRGE